MLFKSATLCSFVLAGVPQALTPSEGCGKPLPPDQQPHRRYNGTINGRRFVYYIPMNYDPDEPLYTGLLVSYHGGSRNPEFSMAVDRFTDPEYNSNKIAIYPEGTSRPGCDESGTCSERWWSTDPDIRDVDDAVFTTAIIDKIAKDYCFDTERIFAVGKGQGAALVGDVFACDSQLSSLFAAFATVGGTFYSDPDECKSPFEFRIPCNPGRPIKVVEFHGLQASIAPYTGGPRRGKCLPSIPWWAEKWAERNGLSTDGETVQLLPNTPSTFITRYGIGDRRGEVTHVYSENVGDEWASIFPNVENGGNVAEYDGIRYLLEFFYGYLSNMTSV